MNNPVLNTLFSRAHIAYTWQCTKCGAEKTETIKLYRGDMVCLASVPQGWTKLGDFDFICPKHQIVVLIDDKVIE